MLNFAKSRFSNNRQSPTMPGSVIPEEGMALVFTRIEGSTVVELSTGASDKEVFAGFSFERTVRPEQMPKVEEATITNGQIRLGRTPISGQLAIFTPTDVITEITSGTEAPTGAGNELKAVINGDIVLFHADQADKPVRSQFIYEPTIAEARSFQGEGNGFTDLMPNAEIGTVGRIAGGIVSTNMYDIAADWSDLSIMHPNLGANGRLTIGGSGTQLTKLAISEAPNADNQFLTVEFLNS